MKNDYTHSYTCNECGKGLGDVALLLDAGDFCNGCIEKLVKIGLGSVRERQNAKMTWSDLRKIVGDMSADLVNKPIPLRLPNRTLNADDIVGVRFESIHRPRYAPHLCIDDSP